MVDVRRLSGFSRKKFERRLEGVEKDAVEV